VCAGPKPSGEFELQDVNLSCDTQASTRLFSTFSEIDELFRTAFLRSLALENEKMGQSYDNWKINLHISPKDYEDFVCHIDAEKISSGVIILRSLTNKEKTRFWRLAIDFLILENDGFSGRSWFKNNNLEAYPRPKTYVSGFSKRILDIDKIASHLPRQIIEAMGSISHLPSRGDVLRHLRTRIYLLDSLFESTYSARIIGDRLVSLAAQIEQSWYGFQSSFLAWFREALDMSDQ